MRKKSTNAYVWGYNNTGELGLSHAARVFSPTPARLPEGITDLQGGANFTVALTSAGKVYTWGGNQHGQLGDGTRQPRREPKKVRLPGGAKAAGIAAGTDHVLVVTTHGDVVSWGRNHRGQLGTDERTDRLSPKAVSTVRVRTVAAGDGVSAAITAAGRLLTWGRNGADQLAHQGSVPPGQDVLKPKWARRVEGRVQAVDAGLRHLVVLTRGGRVLAFGRDVAGKPLDQRVAIGSGWGEVRAISAGEDHTLALTEHGVVLGWGANDLGQLGVADRGHRLSPVEIPLDGAKGKVTQVRAGHRHGLALTDSDEVFSWGDGRFGAVGAGRPKPEATSYPTPQRVPLRGVTAKGLGGGGYSSVVFVDRGPAVRLTLAPATATVDPGKPVRYTIRQVDAFDADLGPAPGGVALKVRGGTVTATTATGTAAGSYTVTARAGTLIGRAGFHVRAGAR